MDGIQPYARPGRLPTLPTTPVAHTHHPAAKQPSDYFRALRRRIWMVLAIGVPLTILSGIFVAYQANVYCAKTQLLIQPPEFDAILATLISRQGGPINTERAESYVPNRVAMLRSPALAQKVVNDASLTQGKLPPDDAAEELIAAIQVRNVPGTSLFTVQLEGADPARTGKQLQLLVDAFRDQAKAEIDTRIEDFKSRAQESLTLLQNDVKSMRADVDDILKKTDTVGPGGKNLKQFEYESLMQGLLNDRYDLRNIETQAVLAQGTPRFGSSNAPPGVEGRMASLEQKKDEYIEQLEQIRRRTRFFDSEPAAKATAKKLNHVLDQLDKLHDLVAPTTPVADPYETLGQTKREEIRQKEEMAQRLLAEMRESMPTHQKFLDKLDDLKQKNDQYAEIKMKIWEFNGISSARKEPVVQLAPVAEPTVPVRPRRAINMAIAIVLSFGLGIALVCMLEHVDHSVKVPEQLAAGLSLPLFGVIPKIRRTALLHRGGHLWTPGAPDSIEADAFRNLRASLLGVADKRGPLVTLLVTSAKAGEGKSTTALNLAATCARAGERTLLMDVDLRRPSLAGVFQQADDEGSGLGLVDVLRGDLPWQRTVVRTDIPNLDFLPTGDTTGIPIEILGTLELRQLIIGLSNHYDRVILDGPAILGLADCRMLGRLVNASILVVRSGAQELSPLQHAKSMLEQSHVVIAGVVFNGLFEDLKNWSSYGPETPYGYTGSGSGTVTRGLGASRNGLESPDEDHAALPMAESLRS